jgi:genome maintenance exonuclease 1
MITNKYNYKKLKRQNVNGKRHYLLEDSTEYTPMPSVTTILDITKPQADKDALAQWKKNVGKQRAQAITTEAAGRGTRMHKYLEDYCITDELATPGTNPYAKQANKMASIIVKEGMSKVDEIWGVEVPLCHPNIYAGTTDLVGIHDGDEAIMDFKQTNKPKKEEWIESYYLQLCAYGEAHNALHGTNIRKGVIMMCSKDFEYQEFIINLEDFDKYRKLWWHRVEEYFEK